jgi:hypothetical protein
MIATQQRYFRCKRRNCQGKRRGKRVEVEVEVEETG